MKLLYLIITICNAITIRIDKDFTKREHNIINSAIDSWNAVEQFITVDDTSINSIVKGYDRHQLGYTTKYIYPTYEVITITIVTNRIPHRNTLYNVVLHELGHALGLKHNNDPRSIMNSSIMVGIDRRALNTPMFALGLFDMCSVNYN